MIIILLPAYNEEKSLSSLMEKMQKFFKSFNENYKIIVCNDGSVDQTQEILEKYQKIIPIEIIQHPVNRGLAETVRDLFERAVQITNKDDIILRLDCDDTHEPKFLINIIDKIREGFDVVTASRFVPGGGQHGVSFYRGFVSRCANIFMKIFFPIKGLKEYSCGYRGYKAKKIHEAIEFYGNDFIQLKGLGFTCTLEKLVKLKLIGATFSEVPFVLRYDQKKSESKMVSSVTTLGYLIMAFLYHWPFGGWRLSIKKKFSDWKKLNKHS
jgi:dolichol-phosphate mannosyltransferase